jgi:methyl halide transferase
MGNLSKEYWSERYQMNQTGWDLGEIAPPIKAYIDQLEGKSLSILIPGCGNGHEGSYLFENGFKNVHLLDFAIEPLRAFKLRSPFFPDEQLHQEDFFNHQGQYDLIIEQTLFCAIDPSLRLKYAVKLNSLLNEKGKVVGLLFNRDFQGGPPFGGNKEEYNTYFNPNFSSVKMEVCYNSIAPRKGTELFIQFKK